jgi:prepilin-type N-terminal cleavage/methylation domain-containing protein
VKLVSTRPRVLTATCPQESGFTLVEAMCAIVIFAFGLMAVSNLLLIAAGSNTVASNQTATAEAAQQRLEMLRTTSFNNLGVGGNLDADVAGFFEDVYVEGVSWVHTRWQSVAVDIPQAGGVGTPVRTKMVYVRSFPRTGAAGVFTGTGQGRGTSEFAVVRSCANQSQTTPSPGCPCAVGCVVTP